MTYLYRLIYNYFERKYILQSSKAPLNILLLLLFLLYLILGNMIRYGWCWLLQDFYLFKLNFNSSVKILMTFCRLRGGGVSGWQTFQSKSLIEGSEAAACELWMHHHHSSSSCFTQTHTHTHIIHTHSLSGDAAWVSTAELIWVPRSSPLLLR